MTSEPPFDAIVVGAGPAGTSAALVLRAAGRRVALVERERFPRFHIGESLLPYGSTLFDGLGIGEAVRAAGFTAKWGVTFVAGEDAAEQRYDFARFGGAWHVPRAEFDDLLLRAAVARGAVRIDGNAKDVAFAPDGVRVTLADGRQLRGHGVVDASGRAGLIARKLGLRELDPRLRKAAVYAHYRGVPQPEGRAAGDLRVVSLPDLSWAWLIPLPHGITSVGIVLDVADFERLRDEGPQRLLDALVAAAPVLKAMLADAEPVGPARVESGFCYRAKAYAGDGFVLAGDAGAFIDPVFSSGVQFAMLGGVEAGHCIDAVFRDPAAAARTRRRFAARQMRRYDFVMRFARAFYRPGLRDLFFAPTQRCGLVAALSSVLAGRWQPTPTIRARLLGLFALAKLQERRGFVPRRHRRATLDSARRAGDPRSPTLLIRSP
jgi:flavin-dependent dehydrogenase